MAKVTNLKRLSKDDFPTESHELVDKLAFALNPFLEQVASAFNKNIDFDNLNMQFINLETEVDNNGKPKLNQEIKPTLKSRVRGIICASAQNLRDTTYPTGTPFLSYTVNNGVITITNITNLPANKRFILSIILIG